MFRCLSENKIWIGNLKYDVKKVFPAENGTFMGIQVPVPKNVKHVLQASNNLCALRNNSPYNPYNGQATYGKSVFSNCTSNHRNHRNNTGLTVKFPNYMFTTR